MASAESSASASWPSKNWRCVAASSVSTLPGWWKAYASERSEENPSSGSRCRFASIESSEVVAFHGLLSAACSVCCASVRRKYCWRRIRPRSEVGSYVHWPFRKDW